MKDFLEARDATNLFGSRDTTLAAFAAGLIANGEIWMQMIESRNQTTHTYNEETVERIVTGIIDSYMAEFEWIQIKLRQLVAQEPRK